MKAPTPWPVPLLLLALLAAPRPALARPGETEFQEAVIRYSLAKFQQSVRLLKKARRKAREPQLRGRIELYLGLNSAVMGQTKQAQAAFKQALTLYPDVELDETRTKASIVALFREVRRGLLGALTVSADRPGELLVLVDGAAAGKGPGSIKVSVGRHAVEVRSADKRYTYKESVTVAPGQETRISARMVAVAVAAPVKAEPGPKPEAKPQPEPPQPPTPPSKPLVEEPAQRRGRLWTWVAAGGAVVAAGVAIGLGVSADADYDAYNDPATPEARGLELQDGVEGKALGANVLFGVAGALAVTAAVLFFVEGRTEAPRRVALTPGIADGPGLGLAARF